MLRVLFALADPVQARALHGRFGRCFAELLQIEAVGGALYALTSRERQKADLIVSGAALEDMDGRDLYDLVRDDSALSQIPFILLDSASLGRLAPLPGHVVLDSAAPAAEVLAAATALLIASGRLGERVQRDEGVKVSGTFEALNLFDLLVSLRNGRKSGELRLAVGDAEASMGLREGNLVHASFAGAVGEEAVLEIFAAVERDPQTEFMFVGSAEHLGASPVTIRKSVDKLLLRAAVALDEQKKVVTHHVRS